MEVNVNVHIPGLPELADALKTIAAVPSISLSQALTAKTEPDEPVAPVAEPVAPKKAKTPAPEAPAQEEASAAEGKPLKLEDVRAAMLDKQKEVGTPPIKELLKSLGVLRLSEMPAEKYPDFLKGLGELHA